MESTNSRSESCLSVIKKLFIPIDNSSIIFFRIAFGFLMLWEVFHCFENNNIKVHYIAPAFHFTYFGFEWIQPWAGNGMYIHFIALGIISIFIAIGFLYRLSSILFFLGFTYVFLLEKADYLNHFYLICLISFLMIFIPANSNFSVDSLINPKIKKDTIPAWSLWLLRIQIGIPYFYGGLAKINYDWLMGEPIRTWIARRSNFPLIGQYFHLEAVVYIFVLGGLLIDLLSVPLLMWKRTRLITYIFTLLFHLMNARLFSIGVFPWFMVCATLLFF